MQIPVQVFVYHITTSFLHVSYFCVNRLRIFKTNFLFKRTMYVIFPSVKLEKIMMKSKEKIYDIFFFSEFNSILFSDVSQTCCCA